MNSWFQQTFLQYLMAHQSYVSNTAQFFQIFTLSLFCFSVFSWFFFQLTKPGLKNAHKKHLLGKLWCIFWWNYKHKSFPKCSFCFGDSVFFFFLNRLTSLKVQSIVWNHQPLHTKSAWLHANQKIKGSEVGTVIQRERVVCLKAYRFIPSCIFTSKPLSMQISLVWTVDSPITSYFCLFFFLSL